ncbi:unnamed protein product [Calicophoron daubneyi]|uniref:Uncharacterized protein n=1 Tax=Calicophoron daubneyi TaxID=300641 RepID=A0AAV2TNW6_CALDB
MFPVSSEHQFFCLNGRIELLQIAVRLVPLYHCTKLLAFANYFALLRKPFIVADLLESYFLSVTFVHLFAHRLCRECELVADPPCLFLQIPGTFVGTVMGVSNDCFG